MKALVYIFHCIPQNTPRYRIPIRNAGIECEIIPIVRNGLSSVYRQLAAEVRTGSGSYLDGLIERYPPLRLDPSDRGTAIVVASWSAGYGFPIVMLEHEPDAERLDGLVFIDSGYAGMHADGSVAGEQLGQLLSYAQRAARIDGTQVLWDGYADVPTCYFDGTRWQGYSSTEMVARWLSEQLGGDRGGFHVQPFDLGGNPRSEHIAAMMSWGPGWLTGALEQLRDRRVAAGIEPHPSRTGEDTDPAIVLSPRGVLRRGARGPDVVAWQRILLGAGHDLGVWGADGVFGAATDAATRAYQCAHRLVVDGIVGPQTWSAAGQSAAPEELPPVPGFRPLDRSQLAETYGQIGYQPVGDANGSIRITNGWDHQHMAIAHLPQIRHMRGAPMSGRVACHRLAVEPLQRLWEAWKSEGLVEHVLSWDGLYNPRYVRGSPGLLSEHAYGVAFDINARWNPYRKPPAGAGQRGSVAPLVPIANDLGWWWRGHSSPQDGMHFVLARPS